jgi:dihydrofolate synthase/folylpolyglutamate synthase
LADIAFEKAGIVKPRVPVVSAPQAPEAADVLHQRAAECEAQLRFVESELDVALAGTHQRRNAALALAALHDGGIALNARQITAGLTNVEWPARFQRVSDTIIIDGAHNPAGARVLRETWRAEFGDRKPVIIAGMLRDKDAHAFWNELSPMLERVVLPKFRGARALPPNELERTIKKVAPDASVMLSENFADALRLVADQLVLVTGSLHFAGEALAFLRDEPYEDCAQ